MSDGDFIYIHSEGIYGELVSYGAHVSKVRYIKDKTLFETYVENDDFESAAAIFGEFVVDGVDPESAPKFEWLYANYGVED